jgi:DNA processing protein
MTPLDAAGLAVIGLKHRRLSATLLRVLTGRATAEESESLPSNWRAELECVKADAQRQLTRAASLGIRAIPFGSADYPSLLTTIADPPPILWVRGPNSPWTAPTVAIVGSRAATPYGLGMARRIATDLVAAGVTVSSGLARGIDSAAHVAVIAAQGRTIGVLGCGPDRIYPAEHGNLARDIERDGAVVSEFPPGVPPLPHHFPLRNRIISGLSIAVVVVEAAEKSGALITASAAAEQGRDVMVVPGPASAGRNRGGHLLIRDGAKVVETAEDILEEYPAILSEGGGGNEGVEVAGKAGRKRSSGASWQRGAGPPMVGVPEAVDFTVDDVAAHTGESPGVVLARLLDLELAGQIQRVGGGRFVRVLT